MPVDGLRHLTVFRAGELGDTRVDIIGCGAVGSKVAVELAKLGVLNLHLWDMDHVEQHNLANQFFTVAQEGQNKAVATAENCLGHADNVPTVHDCKYEGQEALGQVVFVSVDRMDTRKAIFDGLKFKPGTNVLIEARMGVDECRVYTINPTRPTDIRVYEGNLYTDEEADVNPDAAGCRAAQSVGATSGIVSGICVWQFIRWHRAAMGGDAALAPEKEVMLYTRPFMLVSNP